DDDHRVRAAQISLLDRPQHTSLARTKRRALQIELVAVMQMRDSESFGRDVRPDKPRKIGADHEIGPMLGDAVRREPPELDETIDEMDLLQLVPDGQVAFGAGRADELLPALLHGSGHLVQGLSCGAAAL